MSYYKKIQVQYLPLKQVLRKTDFPEDNRVENQMWEETFLNSCIS